MRWTKSSTLPMQQCKCNHGAVFTDFSARQNSFSWQFYRWLVRQEASSSNASPTNSDNGWRGFWNGADGSKQSDSTTISLWRKPSLSSCLPPTTRPRRWGLTVSMLIWLSDKISRRLLCFEVLYRVSAYWLVCFASQETLWLLNTDTCWMCYIWAMALQMGRPHGMKRGTGRSYYWCDKTSTLSCL